MNVSSALPFDDIKRLIENVPPLAKASVQKYDLRQKDLISSDGLEIISGLARDLTASQGQHPPQILRPECAIFVGSHGVLKNHKVTQKTNDDILKEINAISAGTMPINQVCTQYGAGLKIFEVGVNIPTDDITSEDSMSEKEAVSTIAYGMEAVAQGGDVLILSSMGAGSNFVAAVTASFIMGGEKSDWFHPDDTQNEAEFNAQMACFDKIKKRHPKDYTPLEVLRRVGGREIAALIGAIIASRYQNIPVILDSLSAVTAALLLQNMNPESVTHCFVGHVAGHQAFINVVHGLEKNPVLDLGFACDGGIGGVSSLGVFKTAVAIHNFSDIKPTIVQNKKQDTVKKTRHLI